MALGIEGENPQIARRIGLMERAGLYHLWAETGRAGGVVVGDKFVIGPGAKVLFKSAETLTLGDDSVIGANAVVAGSIPPREVRAGMPAR